MAKAPVSIPRRNGAAVVNERSLTIIEIDGQIPVSSPFRELAGKTLIPILELLTVERLRTYGILAP